MADIQFKATLEILIPLVIIDYIISCYGALHTMGGLAITEDIDSLIEEVDHTMKKDIPNGFAPGEF